MLARRGGRLGGAPGPQCPHVQRISGRRWERLMRKKVIDADDDDGLGDLNGDGDDADDLDGHGDGVEDDERQEAAPCAECAHVVNISPRGVAISVLSEIFKVLFL